MPPETINDFFSPVSTDIAHQNIDELIALNTLKDAGSISAADPLWNKYIQGAEAVGDWLVEKFPPTSGRVEKGTPEYEQAEQNIRRLFGFIPQEKWEIPFLAAGGLFPKGIKYPKKLDITDLSNWMKKESLYPNTDALQLYPTKTKVYHGTPIRRTVQSEYPELDLGGVSQREVLKEPLRAGIHVGSPGAAIDRLSKKVPWSADPEYNMGVVHGMKISPTKPLTKQSPDYDYISKELWKQDKSLSSYYGGGSKNPHPYIIDEFSDVDKRLLEMMGSPENVKLISDLGYDVIPYINFFEHPRSVSLNVLNPKKAGLELIDEVYTVPTPFRQSSQAYLKKYDDREPYNEIEIIQDLIDAVTIP